MKITIEKQNLLHIVKLATTATGNIKKHHQFVHLRSNKNTLTIIGNIDTYAISASDICEGDDMDVVIDSAKLIKAVNAAKSTITIEYDGTNASIKYGRSKLKIQTMDINQYPIVNFNDNNPIDVNAELMSASIDSISHSIAVNDVRTYLNGMFIDTDGHMVATDGHRISFVDTGINVGQSVIIPRDNAIKIAKSFAGVGNVNLSMTGGGILISSPSVKIYTALIDGKFPEWKAAIFKPEFHFSVDYDDLIDAIKTAMITASSMTSGVIEVSGGTMTISSTNNTEQSSTDIDCDSQDFKMGIKLDYMLSAVQSAGDRFSIGVLPSRGMVISNDTGYSELIMQMLV